MKQDVIIRWLMDSVNAEELAQANENGTTIAYFAGVAQRFPANDLQANNARPRRGVPAVVEERDEQPAVQPARRQPARQPAPAAAPAVDLNNENENPPARQPARRAVRQAPAGEDRIRVGQY